MGGRRGLRWAGACCLLAVIGSATAGPAGATADRGRAGSSTCAGTQATPGVLSGTYASGATVTGYCEVDGGATTVDGTLTVAAGATLVASYAKNDVAGSGTSSLTVTGNLKVGSGATLILGARAPTTPVPTIRAARSTAATTSAAIWSPTTRSASSCTSARSAAA